MMNEITRIHIAKTAYDIEIAAKKQLEKYIKSLEAYTQDTDVLADIEIRITEILAERNVKPGGVIASEDVSAVRAQLGEPYEFAGDEGDIAVGAQSENSGRRLYRSTDNAVLGGVLSGVAAYFNINPLWARLGFIFLLFISFGFALIVYVLFWIMTPPARTATEKLQLAGKEVTLESIKELNASDDGVGASRTAPILQQILSIGLGSVSALAAVFSLALTAWMVIAALTYNEEFMEMTNNFGGLGDGSIWLVWVLFWIVVLGTLLLTALFGLIAYAFLAKKLTKKMVISGVIIVLLGIASVATVIGVSSTQSLRIANETRSLVRETKVALPETFGDAKSLTFTMKENSDDSYVSVRYVIDKGPARYELTALPGAKAHAKVEGTNATISLEIPKSFRNGFVQPLLTVYGPALETIANEAGEVSYTGSSQESLKIVSSEASRTTVEGSFIQVSAEGTGYIDLSSSSVQSLMVDADHNLSVSAGTVRELTVTQPDVCPSGTYNGNTNVRVAGVTSGQILLNGKTLPVATHQTTCATIELEEVNENF